MDEIAQLEATIKFKDKEVYEMSAELMTYKQEKNKMIKELQEQVDEYKEHYNR